MKKNLLLVAFAFIIFGMKAQVGSLNNSSELLSEESINQKLQESRTQGVKEWEIAIQSKLLHKRMQQQMLGNGNSVLQKGYTPPPQVNTSGCVNPGFEDGTTNGWASYSGNINLVNLPCNTCATTPGGITNVVNSTSTITGQCTSGLDKYGNFSVVAPGLGSYSMLLNNASAGGKIMKAEYTFVVTPSNTLFSLQYAAVLQSGGHSPNQQPYLHIDATDVTTNSVIPCTQVDVTAPSSGAAAGWFVSNIDATVSYRPWTPITLNLLSSIGHTVTINFTVSDCNQGGHFGYCYIDGDCSNPNNATSISGFCGTSTGTVTMVAPPGYSTYQWYGPNPPYSTTITSGGGNTATLTTAAAIGDTFLVNTTTAAGCVVPYKVVVKPSGINVSTSSQSTCKGGSQGSVSASVGGSGGTFNYAWTNPLGASIGTTSTISNLPAGTYSVHVTDASNSCPPKDTTVKIASINPVLQPTVAVLCGTQTMLNAGPGSSYTWYDTTDTQTSVITQTYNVAHGTNGQHYTVTYIDPTTGCLDSTKISLNQVNITFTPQKVNPCVGGSSGSLTFNASPNNSFSSYDWAITGGTTSNASNATPPFNFPNLPAGTYTMIISAPGNTSCFYVDTVTLVNSGVIPVSVDSNNKVCTNDILVLNPNAPSTSSNSWTGTGLTSGANTGSTLTINTAFTNTVTGYYNYTDTIKTSQGCKSVYKAVVKVKSFVAKITMLEGILCYHDSTGKLKATVSGEKNGPISTPNTYSFNWMPAADFSAPNPATANGSNASSTKGGTLKAGTYTCMVTNGNCVYTATYTLLDKPPLHTDSLYAYYCPKDSLALLVANSGNTNYVWHKYGNGGVYNAGHDSIQVPTQDINSYYVTYKSNGCADTAKTVIPVTTYNAFRPEQTVNVFTPNGDGKNDVFFPFYQANLTQNQIYKQAQDYTLKVYNRWGILMYETTEYNKPWDGKTKGGSDAEDGSYFYVVTYQSNCGTKADVVEKKGFVELLR